MNKKRFLLFGIILLIGIPLIISLLSSNKKQVPSSLFPTVTPAQNQPGNQSAPLDIVTTDPKDKATEVPISQQIKITFTRSFSMDEISFASNPIIPYSSNVEGQTLIITPKQPYSAGVLYTYSINYASKSNVSRTFSFTVAGPAQPLPDTQDTKLYNEEQNYYLKNYPDTYLANHTPYSTSDFSISSQLGSPYDSFTVVLFGADKTASKNAFLAWLKSLGLTDSQIAGLSITYQ